VRREFVPIAGGEFLMGASAGEPTAFDDEKPQHLVRITGSFELGKYLVTQSEWESVMGTNPSSFRGPRLPVECVSWHDAQDFLQKLNQRRDGYSYRLPTEAEWEYAARAGTTTMYPGLLDSIAWNDKNSGSETHPVGRKAANRWGLYDVIGNVSEWCQDWFDPGYYATSPLCDPPGPAAGTKRVRRGGSWGTPDEDCRVSCRYMGAPDARYVGFGFRCLREARPAR
jgi:formylglycine-generating enzyme required for sulfatase activity